MTDQPDPERLLAEALRAQAVRAPVPQQEPGSSDSLMGVLADRPYGLLSGQSYRIEQPTSVQLRQPYVDEPPVARPISVAWIVALAILLGLAAGAVTGLASLL